ncbi:MAG: thiamine pyrophosphate-binding protein [Coriobacteriia bacterium]|nr:thiamine pyrophosphate-binding protein [Coriobacteriia bacterium]
MRVADHIAASLAKRGVTRVFEMTGGMITFLLDAMYLHGGIEITSLHHEQAAAFAAEGWARMAGIPGVALATSGPGATNLLTGVASCWFDSTPAVFITGQVNRAELRGERPVRQIGFQETDIVAMARPVVKVAHLVQDPAAVPGDMCDAFEIALAGRPGPVLLDVPMDVQRAETGAVVAPCTSAPAAGPAAAEVRAALDILRSAARPLLLAGAGVRIGDATADLRAFARATGVPVVTSLPGLDAIAFDDPLRVGMIGTYGNRWANLALGDADAVLVIGSRLDLRQTSARVAEFVEGKRIVQVDIDAGEIGTPVPVEAGIAADAGAFLRAALSAWGADPPLPLDDWRRDIDALRGVWPDVAELAALPGINPNVVMHELSRAPRAASAFVADVGQNQMWAGQSLEIGEDQRFMTSAGLGSMGFALPAALGAALAVRDRAGRASSVTGPVVCITGDGGLQVNLQELESVVRLGAPVKIVVLDNRCLGMVRQFQDDLFDSRRQSTEWGYGAPDFVALAAAFGLPAESVSDPSQVVGAVDRLMADPGSPALLRVEITGESSVSPKVAFGRSVADMDPPVGT